MALFISLVMLLTLSRMTKDARPTLFFFSKSIAALSGLQRVHDEMIQRTAGSTDSAVILSCR